MRRGLMSVFRHLPLPDILKCAHGFFTKGHKLSTKKQKNNQQTKNKQQVAINKHCVIENMGFVMRSTKSNGSIEIGQSIENDIAAGIHALTRTSDTFHRPENGNGAMSADNLGTLLRRVSEASTREV